MNNVKKADLQNVTKKGNFALAGGVKVPGLYKLHTAKDRVTFTSDAESGPLAVKAVIYVKATPTIAKGDGYYVTGSNSGAALAKAAKVTFPASLVALCEKLQAEGVKVNA